jgi:hypothetical protein
MDTFSNTSSCHKAIALWQLYLATRCEFWPIYTRIESSLDALLFTFGSVFEIMFSLHALVIECGVTARREPYPVLSQDQA